MPGHRRPISLSDEQIRRLTALQSSPTEPRTKAIRAGILLRYARGESISEIARKENVSRPTVHLCIDKALAVGVEGAIRDLTHTGRPAAITAEDKEWVKQLARTKPSAHGFEAESWTIRELAGFVRKHARETGSGSLEHAGTSTIHRVLREFSPRPRSGSRDEEEGESGLQEEVAQVLFVSKELEIYRGVTPPVETGRGFLSGAGDGNQAAEDSERIWAALAPMPAPLSSSARGCKRIGFLSLLSGIDLYDGHIMALIRDRMKSPEFIEFLAAADANYPRGWKIRIAVGMPSLASRQTMKWLKDHPNRFEFVFAPKHGSWLNLVEAFFLKMTGLFLMSLRVKSESELVKRLYDHLDEANFSPFTFPWEYVKGDALL